MRNGIYFHQSFGPRRRRMRSPSFALVLVGGVLLFGLLALGLYLGGVIFSVVKEAWPHG